MLDAQDLTGAPRDRKLRGDATLGAAERNAARSLGLPPASVVARNPGGRKARIATYDITFSCPACRNRWTRAFMGIRESEGRSPSLQ